MLTYSALVRKHKDGSEAYILFQAPNGIDRAIVQMFRDGFDLVHAMPIPSHLPPERNAQ